MGSNDYNTEPEEIEEENDDKYYESSTIEDDDNIEFANRHSRPQQRLNRVCSGDGDLVKLRNVHNNENDDDFSPPPPSFTTTTTSLSSFSALKAATALAGVNLSLTRGWV